MGWDGNDVPSVSICFNGCFGTWDGVDDMMESDEAW